MTTATETINASRLNVRWREDYISQGVNRRALTIPRGAYRGLWLASSGPADTNLNLTVEKPGLSLGMDVEHLASIEDTSEGVSISYRNVTDPVVLDCSTLLPTAGAVTWTVWMEVVYSTGSASAGVIRVSDSATPPDDAVILGEVVFTGVAATISEGVNCSFSYTNREEPKPTAVAAYSSYVAGDNQWGMISGEERYVLNNIVNDIETGNWTLSGTWDFTNDVTIDISSNPGARALSVTNDGQYSPGFSGDAAEFIGGAIDTEAITGSNCYPGKGISVVAGYADTVTPSVPGGAFVTDYAVEIIPGYVDNISIPIGSVRCKSIINMGECYVDDIDSAATSMTSLFIDDLIDISTSYMTGVTIAEATVGMRIGSALKCDERAIESVVLGGLAGTTPYIRLEPGIVIDESYMDTIDVAGILTEATVKEGLEIGARHASVFDGLGTGTLGTVRVKSGVYVGASIIEGLDIDVGTLVAGGHGVEAYATEVDASITTNANYTITMGDGGYFVGGDLQGPSPFIGTITKVSHGVVGDGGNIVADFTTALQAGHGGMFTGGDTSCTDGASRGGHGVYAVGGGGAGSALSGYGGYLIGGIAGGTAVGGTGLYVIGGDNDGSGDAGDGATIRGGVVTTSGKGGDGASIRASAGIGSAGGQGLEVWGGDSDTGAGGMGLEVYAGGSTGGGSSNDGGIGADIYGGDTAGSGDGGYGGSFNGGQATGSGDGGIGGWSWGGDANSGDGGKGLDVLGGSSTTGGGGVGITVVGGDGPTGAGMGIDSTGGDAAGAGNGGVGGSFTGGVSTAGSCGIGALCNGGSSATRPPGIGVFGYGGDATGATATAGGIGAFIVGGDSSNAGGSGDGGVGTISNGGDAAGSGDGGNGVEGTGGAGGNAAGGVFAGGAGGGSGVEGTAGDTADVGGKFAGGVANGDILLGPRAGNPVAASEGAVWYNSSDGKLHVWTSGGDETITSV